MADGHRPAGGDDCFVWVAHDEVVAAVRIERGGYFWCQSWPAADLAARAVDAAAAWDVTPDSPPVWMAPADDLLCGLTWLRVVLPLASIGERHPYSLPSDWTGATLDRGAKANDLVKRLVASGLSEPGLLATLTWPALQVEVLASEPSPSMAAKVSGRLRRQEERRQHEADDVRAEIERRPEMYAQRSEEASKEKDDASVAAQYGAATLSEDEFVASMLDGSTQWHLYEWADALRVAVEALAILSSDTDSSALGGLLETTMRLRRTQVSPFEGVLEAPPSIIELAQAHELVMRDLIERRDHAFRPLLREVATTCFRGLSEPPSWEDLIERGAWPVRPHLPDDEW